MPYQDGFIRFFAPTAQDHLRELLMDGESDLVAIARSSSALSVIAATEARLLHSAGRSLAANLLIPGGPGLGSWLWLLRCAPGLAAQASSDLETAPLAMGARLDRNAVSASGTALLQLLDDARLDVEAVADVARQTARMALAGQYDHRSLVVRALLGEPGYGEGVRIPETAQLAMELRLCEFLPEELQEANA